MKKSKIKTVAAVVLQIPAGVEVDVYISETGEIYFPSLQLSPGSGGAEKGTSAKVTEEPAPSKSSKSSPKKSAPEPEEEEGDDLTTAVTEIVTGWDDESLTLKDVRKKLKALSDDEDVQEKVNDYITEVNDEEDEDKLPEMEELIEELVKLLTPPAKSKPKADKAKTKSKSDDDDEEESDEEGLVEPADLEVGQKVSVYWANLKDWYEGEVLQVGKKVVIHYTDDDTDEKLSPEIHTKIKVLTSKKTPAKGKK